MAFVLLGGHPLRPWVHRLRGAQIGENVWISQFVYIDELHPEAVTIQDNSTIGLRTSIFTHFYWGPRKSDYKGGKVVIGRDVFIGPHCVILPDVCIMDIAASIQKVTEEIMLRIGRHVYKETGMKNLCLAGGVALNCVENGKLLREGPYKNIWVQPAAGDAGGALGAALAIWHHLS